jgi:hypothetical protein
MAATNAAKNRKLRQDALREQLAAQGHVQHVVDILTELSEQADEITSLELQKKKLIIDTKLSLIKKYLPDTKQVELDATVQQVTHEQWLEMLKDE